MFKLGELLKDHIEAGSSVQDPVESGSTVPDNSVQELDSEISAPAGEPTIQASAPSDK
jgi:hypothetical protein